MPQNRRPLILALVGALLFLAGLAFWRTSHCREAARERQEARGLVTAALAEPGSEKAGQLFRRAKAIDGAYAACEEGARRRTRGLYAEAARSFDLCLQGDPALAATHRAWAESLLRAHGREAAEEVQTRLRRFLETAEPLGPGELQALEELILDAEDLLAEDSPAEHTGPWTVEELVEILSREGIRKNSRYDGPRVPLRFGFRPGEADLGAAARAQLRDVAKALQDGVLARVTIQIEGHTDDTEAKPESARRALGTRRAEVVREYLVRQHGIPRERLKAVGFADQYPLVAGRTAESRAANRRVELVNMETKEPVMRDARGRE